MKTRSIEHALQRIPDLDIRNDLMQWAKDHRIDPEDTAWALLSLSVLSHRWFARDIEQLQKQSQQLTRQIEQAGKTSLGQVVAQTQGAAETSQRAIHKTLTAMSTEVVQLFARSVPQVVSSVDERIERSWRHSALSSALVGVVLGLFLATLGPTLTEWRQHLHQKDEAFRQSHSLGVRFNTAFSKLEPDRKRQVLELLQWQE